MTESKVFKSIVSNWISAIEFDAIRKANEVAKHEQLIERKRNQACATRKSKTKSRAKELASMMTEEDDDEF